MPSPQDPAPQPRPATPTGLRPQAAAALAGVIFGVALGAYCLIFAAVEEAAALGAGGTLLFGLMIYAVIRGVTSRTAKYRPVLTDETLIFEGAANRYATIGGQGGWLYLSDKALYFRSHKGKLRVRGPSVSWNDAAGERPEDPPLRLALAQVAAVEPSSVMGMPNAFTVTLRDGTREKFSASGYRQWLAGIEGALVRVQPSLR
ncbi:MAG: hypothetical protein KDA64_17255 [Rhodospirillaceae bacterium]|nr:hypothetical protein [Rhodospirillaceae bacterium]